MKSTSIHIKLLSIAAGFTLLASSCVKNLLDQDPTLELPVVEYWKTDRDANTAIMGAYADVRPLFDRDYYLDGFADYQRTRGTSATADLQKGAAYPTGNYSPSATGDRFDPMFRYLYGGVNRTNYVIENVKSLMPKLESTFNTEMERIIGEARLMRGMIYFRLISIWGDVPYFTFIPSSNDQVSSLSRMPIGQIVDSIYADLTYAYEKLPLKSPDVGRFSKASALAMRGKLMLYWASWNRNGWPELSGFVPSATVANAAYASAAADFRAVSYDMGLTLFRNGDPGAVGSMGKADTLPNYYYLFTPVANGDAELVLAFTHGGINTGQGEELMRDVAGRSHEGSQCWVTPRYEIADRYQLTATGNFAPALLPLDASKVADARTRPGSALNPNSYEGRDYRMKSSIMWDNELSVAFASLKSIGYLPFIYKTWTGRVTVNGITYNAPYNTDGCNTGYVYRKFLRNTAGLGRSDGTYQFPVIRLADVYLMYAEATNAINGPVADAIELVNRVRRRGNLPALDVTKTADATSFFAAIEQERIVELLGEGQRFWDLRRWRALERVWGPFQGPGRKFLDTHGAVTTDNVFQNQQERVYQRCYIGRIPNAERERNPNLTQNLPWF